MARQANRFPAWVLALTVLALPLMWACESSRGNDLPGDKIYTGPAIWQTGDGTRITGNFQVVLYEPATAQWHIPGTPGSGGVLSAQVLMSWHNGNLAELRGTWTPQGGLMAQGGGWKLDGHLLNDEVKVRLASSTGATASGVATLDTSNFLGSVEACACKDTGAKPSCQACGALVVCCVPMPWDGRMFDTGPSATLP